MVKIHFAQDTVKTVTVAENTRLLDALLEREVPVKMFCGGKGLCATCHCYITSGMESLTPMSSQESLTVSILTGAKANSRLACQARIIGGDVEVELPKGLYIESVFDLETLVGKRTEIPILHPVTGDTLIAKDKIITRTLIMQLSDVDFDVSSINASKAQ